MVNTLMDYENGKLDVIRNTDISVTGLDSLENRVFGKKGIKRRKNTKHSRSKPNKRHRKRKHNIKRKSGKRIKYTKRGQPYILDKKSGRAKFIKRR